MLASQDENTEVEKSRKVGHASAIAIARRRRNDHQADEFTLIEQSGQVDCPGTENLLERLVPQRVWKLGRVTRFRVETDDASRRLACIPLFVQVTE